MSLSTAHYRRPHRMPAAKWLRIKRSRIRWFFWRLFTRPI